MRCRTARCLSCLAPSRRPPELITEGILTKSADLYAFGVITWEIYVGRCAAVHLLGRRAVGFHSCWVAGCMNGLQQTARCCHICQHIQMIWPLLPAGGHGRG